jgi:hypothetical protein
MAIHGVRRPVELPTRYGTIPEGTDCSILRKHFWAISLP